MIILKPDITVYWNKGVSLAAFSYLYMDTHSEAGLKTRTVSNSGDVAIPIGVTISGGVLTIRDEHLLKHMPGILPLLNEWIVTHNLHQRWLEEQSIYDTIMGSVVLPDAELAEQYRCVVFSLSIGGCGDYNLPTIQARVMVHAPTMPGMPLLSGTVYMGITVDEYEEHDCITNVTICHYPLALPITMDTLKASMCKPFQQYLDYLQG